MVANNAWAEELFSLESAKVTMRMKSVGKDKVVKRINNAILELETANANKESKYQESGTYLKTLGDLMKDIQQNNETLFDTELHMILGQHLQNRIAMS